MTWGRITAGSCAEVESGHPGRVRNSTLRISRRGAAAAQQSQPQSQPPSSLQQLQQLPQQSQHSQQSPQWLQSPCLCSRDQGSS